MAARAQLEQMRGRALPGGGEQRAIMGPGGQIIVPGARFGDEQAGEGGTGGTGQYL